MNMQPGYLVKKLLLIAGVSVMLAACGNGGGSDSDAPPPSGPDADEFSVAGVPVKGPLANAELTLYTIDPAAADLKGRLIGSGVTNANAQIEDLSINRRRLDTVFLVEISSNEDTVDLTSGDAPEIPVLRTLLFMPGAGDVLAQAKSVPPVYATPLSTFTIDIMAALLASGAAEDFASAKSTAEDIVRNAFGLGILDGIDLFATAPVLSDAQGQSQTATLNLRTASEVFAAIIVELRDAGSATTDNIIKALAVDILDSKIDGLDAGSPLADLADIFAITDLVTPLAPENLLIPGTNLLVSEIVDVLADEVDDLGSGVTPDPDDLASIPVLAAIIPGIDTDGDAVVDLDDACPADASGFVDEDGDTFCEGTDVFPLNPLEWADSDGDCGVSGVDFDPLDTDAGNGCGDNSDDCPNGYGLIDEDGDGSCQLLAGDVYDTGLGIDFRDVDIVACADCLPAADVRSVCDLREATDPFDQAEYTPFELDCNQDADGDGFINDEDAFPSDADEWADFDGDGTGDNSQTEYLFTGTLQTLYSASGFDTGFYNTPVGSTILIDYTVTVTINPVNDTVVGSSFELDGSLSTLSAAAIPPFARQSWTFTDAVFANDSGTVVQNLTINRDSDNRITDFAFTVTVNASGGPADDGDPLAGVAPPANGASLQSGTMVCGGGSCGSFFDDIIHYVDISLSSDGVSSSESLRFEFKSDSGSTAYSAAP